MTERLPYVQQNRTVEAGAGHNAQEWRWMNRGLTYLGGIGGVTGPGECKVTTGGGMNLSVAAGGAFIPDAATPAGRYHAYNDAAVTLPVSPAHATLNRIDRVIFQILDTAFGDAEDRARITVVTGTPAASPVAPALPRASITLAQVAVNAAAASIVAGNIVDYRNLVGSWTASIGVLSQQTRGSASLSSNTTYQLMPATNLNLVIGRWYAFKFSGYVSFTTADSGGEILVKRDGANYLRHVMRSAVAGNGFSIYDTSAAFQATSSTMSFEAVMQKTLGTGNMTLDSAFQTPTLEVIDLGGGLT